MRARKPVWTDGLFLTQHHLQRLDAYHEALLGEHLRAVVPFEWGVTDLEIDERALATGQVRVARLAAVLSDGTPLTVGPGQDDEIPARPFDASFPPQLQELDVYVALPRATSMGANVELGSGSAGGARFTRRETTVLDENTGFGDQSVPWASKNLRILFGSERRDDYETVRVARLTRSSTGAVMLSDTFVPPALTLRASPVLLRGFRGLLAAMTAKQRSLSASRRQRSAAAVDFEASDSAKFWLLDTLNMAIPVLAHLVDRDGTHPEAAYLCLAQLVGRLSTFAVDGDPTTIPRFAFLELEQTFPPLFERAARLLETILAERYVEIPLERRDDRLFTGAITDGQVLRYELFLAVTPGAAGVTEADLRERLPRLAKVASVGQIGSILNSAVNGARLDLEYRPPAALPIKPGMVFFRIDRQSTFFADIVATGSIAFYLPIAPGAVSLALYAVDPQNLR